MQKTKKIVSFNIKSITENGIFEGWATRYGVVDVYNEVMTKGCFTDFISRMEAKAEKRPKLLWSHDVSQPVIGKWLSFKDTDEGLFVSGQLYPEHPMYAVLYRGMKDEEIDGLSVGFYGDYKIDSNGVLYWENCTLKETSLCNFNAVPGSVVTAIKNIKDGNGITERDLELILRDSGVSRLEATLIVSSFKSKEGLRDSDTHSDKLVLVQEIKKELKEIANVK